MQRDAEPPNGRSPLTSTNTPAAAALPDPAGTHRIRPLDGLRGFATLAVLLEHYEARQASPLPFLARPWMLVSGIGWVGVDVFFVLSGFLITGILLDTSDEPHRFRLFFARRTLRVFPAYYASLAVLLLLLPAMHLVDSVPASTQGWYWTYTQNILLAFQGWKAAPPTTPHFWSLAIEEQFYLVWPLVVFLLPRRWFGPALCGLIGASALSRLVLAKLHVAPTVILLLTTGRVESLGIGALIAYLLRTPGGAARLRAWGGRLAILSAVGFAAVIAWRQRVAIDDAAISTIGVTCVSWLAGAAIIRFVAGTPPDAWHRLFSSRPLRFFGKYSYGVYIWHYPIMILLARHGFTIAALAASVGTLAVANPLYVAANTALTVAVALTSWTLLERPMLGLKRHFEYARS